MLKRPSRIPPNALLAIVALLAGGGAFWGTTRYVAERVAAAEHRVAGRYRAREVVVAGRDLDAGAELRLDDLAARAVPDKFVPSTAFAPEALEGVLGRRLRHALKAGDPLLRPTLLDASALPLSAQLPSGQRAITFPVDEVNSFDRQLVPGDVIDLLYVAAAGEDSAAAPTVRTLLQRVVVMATGRATRRERVRDATGTERETDVSFTTITLNVPPSDAARIVLAQRLGELSAVLRNPEDRASVAQSVLAPRDLLDLPPLRVTRQSTARPRPGIDFLVGGHGDGRPRRLRLY